MTKTMPLADAQPPYTDANHNRGRLAVPAAEARAEELFVMATAHHQAGRLAEAENGYRRVLALNPRHVATLGNLGIALRAIGRQGEAEMCYRQALEIMPDFAEAHSNLGNILRDLGRLEGAEASYRRALKVRPDYADAHYNLGRTLHDLGRLVEAETCYRRALETKPNFAEAHSNLGDVLFDRDRPEDAEASYRRALEIKPNFPEALCSLGNVLCKLDSPMEAEAICRRALEVRPDFVGAHLNLGNALRNLGRLEEAETCYRSGQKINPDSAEAYCNLGNVLRDLGRLEEARICLRRALELKPNFAEALYSLGADHLDHGQLAEAEASYRHALEIRPDYVEAHCNLGATLLGLGRPEDALRCCMMALKINETWDSKKLFVECVGQLHFTIDDVDIRSTLVRALSEPWDRPSVGMRAGATLVKLNPGIGACVARSTLAWPQRLSAKDLFSPSGIVAVLSDSLLHIILVSSPISDLELERFLTMARHAMLAAVSEETNEDGAVSLLDFQCALAQQCFINEYVYDWTPGEAELAPALRGALITALATEAIIPAALLIAVASYYPLHSIPNSGRLLDRSWPEAVIAVLTQQIQEPEEERLYRAAIPRLTAIEADVSLLVQQQYEENPYPRWIKAAPADKPKPLDILLRQTLPLASFQSLGNPAHLDILIAGCGTGQHSIQSAQLYSGARVLAIDLSLTSLCYAKRKTKALGLKSIEYAQADIVQLESLGRTFDVIESVGVLHHLADPMAGWRVLLSLLRPKGLMRLGLYSEVARRDIVRGRDFISKKNYGTTTEDIRKCRQALMSASPADETLSFLHTANFFSISECRDLLFHVQEHRLSLVAIDAFINENDLLFLGFDIERRVLESYRVRFPNDLAATNLSQWQIFENENPNTFISMYQFWVQKADGATNLAMHTNRELSQRQRSAPD